MINRYKCLLSFVFKAVGLLWEGSLTGFNVWLTNTEREVPKLSHNHTENLSGALSLNCRYGALASETYSCLVGLAASCINMAVPKVIKFMSLKPQSCRGAHSQLCSDYLWMSPLAHAQGSMNYSNHNLACTGLNGGGTWWETCESGW